MKPTAHDIDRLLPQTQCERCGYSGCRPYARAIADGDADINRCPPGGDAVIAALAELTGRAVKPLDPACGQALAPAVAVIDEEVCIGCTRCIQVCPVDAIVGAAKLMHTIIAPECTGCELCLPPCPVDCIDIVEAKAPIAAAAEPAEPDAVEAVRLRHVPPAERQAADYARRRFEARAGRLQAEQQARDNRRRDREAARTTTARRSEIDAMVAAVRARRGERHL